MIMFFNRNFPTRCHKTPLRAFISWSAGMAVCIFNRILNDISRKCGRYPGKSIITLWCPWVIFCMLWRKPRIFVFSCAHVTRKGRKIGQLQIKCLFSSTPERKHPLLSLYTVNHNCFKGKNCPHYYLNWSFHTVLEPTGIPVAGSPSLSLEFNHLYNNVLLSPLLNTQVIKI